MRQLCSRQVREAVATQRDDLSRRCLGADGQVSLKMAQDQHRDSETELQKDERALKLDLKEMELSHEDYIKSLKAVRTRTHVGTAHRGGLTQRPASVV